MGPWQVKWALCRVANKLAGAAKHTAMLVLRKQSCVCCCGALFAAEPGWGKWECWGGDC
jgi:hypothetical protein